MTSGDGQRPDVWTPRPGEQPGEDGLFTQGQLQRRRPATQQLARTAALMEGSVSVRCPQGHLVAVVWPYTPSGVWQVRTADNRSHRLDLGPHTPIEAPCRCRTWQLDRHLLADVSRAGDRKTAPVGRVAVG